MNSILIGSTLAAVLCGLTMTVSAQTWSEWFHQTKTRLKYLRQQSAALFRLEQTIENGYIQEEGGLDSVETNKQEEYLSHKAFYHSLQVVNPAIKKLDPLQIALHLEDEMANTLTKELDSIDQSIWLLDIEKTQFKEELSYTHDYTKLFVSETKELLESSPLQITDADRQKDVDLNIQLIREYYTKFFRQVEEINYIIHCREHEELDLDMLKNLE